MLFPPKIEEVNFLIGLQVIQLCLGEFQVQMNFFDKNNKSSHINISIDTPEFIEVDMKNIASVSDYAMLNKFIGKKITDVKVDDDTFILTFENGYRNC